MHRRIAPLLRRTGFTLVEMLVVMVIIAVLAGLVLSGAGFAQKNAARKRAASEIAAMEAAAESYKADNGIYPSAEALDPGAAYNASAYRTASLALYKALSGDTNGDRSISQAERDAGSKQYMEFKPNMLEPSGGTENVTAIVDPFGTSYGYSTIYQADPNKGFNPTFDLWSTGGKTGNMEVDRANWITNW